MMTLDYLAGYLDGDGTLMRSGPNWRIQAYSIDPSVIYRFRDEFGGSVYWARPATPRSRGMFTWYKGERGGSELVNELAARMIIKANVLGPRGPITVPSSAYFAGLFDAEGCIYIRRTLKSAVVNAEVTNTHRGVLDICRSVFRGNIQPHNANPCKDGVKRKECWRWYIAARQAYPLLRALKPYLVVKQEQAEEALKIEELVLNNFPAGVMQDEMLLIKKRIMDLKHVNFAVPLSCGPHGNPESPLPVVV